MTRRRKWIVVTFAASLAILAIWFILLRNPHGDVWEKYRGIQEGMSESEVIGLFGVPPGKYSRDPVAICTTGQADEFAAVDECHSKRVWLFDEGLFEIGLDENLQVQKKVASANMSGGSSVWTRLLHSLGF